MEYDPIKRMSEACAAEDEERARQRLAPYISNVLPFPTFLDMHRPDPETPRDDEPQSIALAA